MSEYALYFVIKMRGGISLNSINVILLEWEVLCLNALYIILLKREMV